MVMKLLVVNVVEKWKGAICEENWNAYLELLKSAVERYGDCPVAKAMEAY